MESTSIQETNRGPRSIQGTSVGPRSIQETNRGPRSTQNTRIGPRSIQETWLTSRPASSPIAQPWARGCSQGSQLRLLRDIKHH